MTEAAAHARRHRNTILIALRTGKLTGFQQKSPQGAWRIRRQDLEAWIKGRS
ncbi:helix-turn-helix domain-containing protein [Rhodococcus hoagii]|nr:helix-turn-helix domain-containing protein [Prescottella equi]